VKYFHGLMATYSTLGLILLSEDEVHEILKSCHDGPCGGHSADKMTRYKVFHHGYYWLTRYAKAYVKR
jgi:hypothetical protein